MRFKTWRKLFEKNQDAATVSADLFTLVEVIYLANVMDLKHEGDKPS